MYYYRNFLTILLLVIVATALCDVWHYNPDPALNQGDWRAEYYHYYDWEIYNTQEDIGSPFYQEDDTHLNAINLGADSDFQPDDGWCLYSANFGLGSLDGGFPMLTLYNKYTGVMRVFMYKTENAPANYSYIALEASYNGNSTLFSIGEENNDDGLKALDKRDELGECSFVTINEMSSSYNVWYYIDFNVMYDPVSRVGDPSIFIKFYGSNISTIDLDADFFAQISAPNVSSSSSIIDMGESVYSHFKDGEKLGQQVQSFLDGQYVNVSSVEINPVNELLSILTTANVVGSIFAGANAVYGLYDFMTANGSDSNVSTSMNITGDITGTMETINNFKTTDIFESFGSRTLTPHYNETLGVVNLFSTIDIEHGVVVYNNMTGAHTYRISSNLLTPMINPDIGLDISPDDFEVALEFEVDFISGQTTWIEEATGYTFDEIIDLGCITEISSAWVGYGFRKKYRTSFVASNDFTGLSFTLPYYAYNVSLKVKSILKRGVQPSDDILFMADFAVDIDHIGNVPEFFAFIPEQQEITICENTIISNETVDITNVVSVGYGSTLHYNNCTINLLTENAYGLKVRNGQIKFTNCDVNVASGFIKAIGEESEILIESGSIVDIYYGGIIDLLDKSKLTVDNSTINMHNNGHMKLTGGSLAQFNNRSHFLASGACTITGNTSGYYYDPFTGASSQNPPLTDGSVYISGDRIVIDDSNLDFSNDTIIHSGSNEKWDGLIFTNCNEFIINGGINWINQNNRLRGEISNIKNIVVTENSALKVDQADISNISQMKVLNDSHVKCSDTIYHHNENGIYAEESCFLLVDGTIHNNGLSGLVVCNSTSPQLMYGSSIYDNDGIGLDIHNCNFQVVQSNIYGNERFGYVNLGNLQNMIRYNSVISNNKLAEIATLADYFPMFQTNMLGSPSVVDDEISSEDFLDLYLLMALGTVNGNIDCTNLIIDTSLNNQNRYYPNFDSFVFDPQNTIQANVLYREGMQFIEHEEYENAYDMMEEIVEDYHDTYTAKNALAWLPYLLKAKGGESADLYAFLEEIEAEALNDTKIEVKAILKISDQEYEEAISLYEEIINDPPNDYKQLIAELDEAFCYFKLVTSGSRNLPEKCKRKPRNFKEYAQIKEEIQSELLLGEESNNQGDILPSVPVLFNNFPNPFNPETTISFSIPEDSKVNLYVYNIKGQKVKALSDDTFDKGKHSVVWSGLDDSGKPVSSGVYFYKLSVNGRSQSIKKCLLLK